MENIFGGLIEFETEQELDDFLKNVDEVSSFKVIEAAIEYAYVKGVFTQEETYCVYKSMKKLREKLKNE